MEGEAMSEVGPFEEHRPVPAALRLVFERTGDEVRLLDAIPIDVVVPPGGDLEVDDAERAGFAVRLIGEDGSLVYRRAMADPLAREAEVYTGDAYAPWERVPVQQDTVRFDIVVPNTGGDDEVELVASPPRRGREDRGREAARRVFRSRVRRGRPTDRERDE
jgi:hypothetical protein